MIMAAPSLRNPFRNGSPIIYNSCGNARPDWGDFSTKWTVRADLV
jgi:hypothetical protein